MSDCIYCKIIAGEVPSYCIYEDDLFKVLLDIYPSTVGHTLIIPKEHAANIFELGERQAAALMPLAKKIAIALKNLLNCDGMNILQNNGETAGQTINHYHMHLIPRYKDDGVIMEWAVQNPTPEDFKKILDNIKIL